MSVYGYEAKRLIKEDNNEKEYTIIIETCLSNGDIDKLFESYLSEEAFKKSIDIKENKKGTTYKIFIRNIEGGGTNGKSSQHPNKPSVKLITGKNRDEISIKTGEFTGTNSNILNKKYKNVSKFVSDNKDILNKIWNETDLDKIKEYIIKMQEDNKDKYTISYHAMKKEDNNNEKKNQ